MKKGCIAYLPVPEETVDLWGFFQLVRHFFSCYTFLLRYAEYPIIGKNIVKEWLGILEGLLDRAAQLKEK